VSEMPKTLQDVYDGIIAAHGGVDNFTMPQKVAARALTRVLAQLSEGKTSAASSIPTLESMLPAKVEADEKPWDMTVWTAREWGAFEKLRRKAQGEAPEPPLHRRKSNRYWLGVELAAVLDKSVSGEIGMVTVAPEAMIGIRSLVMALLSPLLVQDLFRATFESAYAPLPSDVVAPLAPPLETSGPVATAESPRAIPGAVNGKQLPPNVVVRPETRHWSDIIGGSGSPAAP
jgi:hypothetical protein